MKAFKNQHIPIGAKTQQQQQQQQQQQKKKKPNMETASIGCLLMRKKPKKTKQKKKKKQHMHTLITQSIRNAITVRPSPRLEHAQLPGWGSPGTDYEIVHFKTSIAMSHFLIGKPFC
jgi:hypothetical protein